ncbi:MAG: VOC family protein [Litoreibacter sp.]|nr:VOC family protein [Litoreibacter sp.]
MSKLESLTLKCPNPKAQVAFYTSVLGFDARPNGHLRYSEDEASLLFEPGEGAYLSSQSDVYWKIAISVPNLDLAYRQLNNQGISVSEPRQFLDVGYLAHLSDPEGFAIELIEHTFKGHRKDIEFNQSLLGGGPCLNLITLRANEIAPIRQELLDWGMRPLCVQPVPSHGFTLHFFAFTQDRPPNADLLAVENRTWTYQRPYTVLEIQEVHGAEPMIHPVSSACGYVRTQIGGFGRIASLPPLGIECA